MRESELFDRAASMLPASLRPAALFLPEERKREAEEIRLRSGVGAFLRFADHELRLPGKLGPGEMGEAVERITQGSYYAAQESLPEGYYTAEGGFRVGFGGSVLMKNGRCAGFRSISSLCIRIPRAVACVDDELLAALSDRSVLIYSAPGAGKTTFLRELVRRISEAGKQVAVADERGELAALSGGVPQFDLGCHTDVLEGCPKGTAAEMLLRTMSPQVLAMDELGAWDLPPLSVSLLSGVRLLATAHASRREELAEKGLPLSLFQVLVHIEKKKGLRSYRLEGAGC